MIVNQKIDIETKLSIKKSITRVKKAKLHTVAVLLVCCFIDGLGKKMFCGSSEYRFKEFIENFMPETFGELRARSCKLKRKSDYCLHVLWRDVRCGLVHEIDPKSTSIILGRRGKSIIHQNVKDRRFQGKDLVISSPAFIDNFLRGLNRLKT